MAIPASRIVNVTPRLIAAGGTDLVMNGLLLTMNPLIPLTSFALTFTSADAVGEYFGMTSDEYLFAVRYFLGVLFAAGVWPMTFGWFGRLGKK